MYARTNQAEQNAYLESCLTIYLSRRPDLFPIVDKFSKHILAILADPEKKQIILEKLQIEENFRNLKNELYLIADYEKGLFKGALGSIIPAKKINDITPLDALQDIVSALKNTNANLIKIMPIHSVFGYRILRLLDPESYNQAAASFADFKKFLEGYKKYVTRKADDKDIPVTTLLGIALSEENNAKIEALKETKELKAELDVVEHRTSFSRFNINNESHQFQNFIDSDAPLVAGLSNHAISLFTAARAYKNILPIQFTHDDLLEYAFAYAVYLTTAGYHTIHEVMFSAANSLGIPYDMCNHLENIPKTNVKLADEVKTAISHFSTNANQVKFSTNLFSHSQILKTLQSSGQDENIEHHVNKRT